MARSYSGKVLRVDLAAGTIRIEERDNLFMRRYMGGWNIIAEVLLREVPAGAEPLGPQNRLVFAPGVLTGLPIAGASRNAIGAKSPLTGGFGASEVGGFWGAELKRAGYDALIVEGAAPQPVYLWINDGTVELRDASHLWGQATKETLAAIRMELGDDRIRCAVIGPGGEHLVRYACIMNDLHDAAGRAGLGAVMGSKRLKAVAVRGTSPVDGADAGLLREMSREFARDVKAGRKAAGLSKYGTGGGNLEPGVKTGNLPVRNFRDGDFPGVAGLSGINHLPKIGLPMEGCYACPVRCKNVAQTTSPYEIDPAYGAPEYETIAALGSCCGLDDYVAVAKAGERCNAYSLDTIGTGVNIALAMECFEKGLLSLEETGGIELRFGNAGALIQMVERIARREGLGDLLAESPREMARRIGRGAEGLAMEVKGQAYPMHEPRLKRALAICYAVSPTGADHSHALHDMGMVVADNDGFIPSEPWYTSALRMTGVVEPVPLESLGAEKVRAAVYGMIIQVMNNCLLMCSFVPWTIEDKTRIVGAATGWDVSAYELLKAAERALTLARVFNVREGLTAADDHLPERSHGPTIGGALANAGIDREALQAAIHTYYGMMGWGRDTGVPLADKLHELGVSWAVGCLSGPIRAG